MQKSSDSECSCGHPDLAHKGQGFAREKAICEKEKVFVSAFRISLTEREYKNIRLAMRKKKKKSNNGVRKVSYHGNSLVPRLLLHL